MPVGLSHQCVTLSIQEGGLSGAEVTLNIANHAIATYVYELLLDGENLRSGEEARKRAMNTMRGLRAETAAPPRSAKYATWDTYDGTPGTPSAPSAEVITW